MVAEVKSPVLLAVSGYRSMALVTCCTLLLIAGVFLFRISRRFDAGSGRSALLDLPTSLWGVCAFFLVAHFFLPPLQPVWVVVYAVLSGVLSSAIFRMALKR